jgi:hypothetical protein
MNSYETHEQFDPPLSLSRARAHLTSLALQLAPTIQSCRYGYALVDTIKCSVANFTAEPPGLFQGWWAITSRQYAAHLI